MSNRIVPATYRAIIDDVMSNIRDHFLEFGVDDQVLQSLQNKWEQKVVESNVAEFEPGPPPAATPAVPQQPLHPQAPPPQANGQQQYSLAVPQPRAPTYTTPSAASSASNLAPYGGPPVKHEPHDTPSPYPLPSLATPAPPPPQNLQRQMMMAPNGHPQPFNPAQVHAMQQQFTPQHLQALANHNHAQAQNYIRQHQQAQQQKPTPTQLQQAAGRMPQVDGSSTFILTPIPSGSSAVSSNLSSGLRMPQVDGPSSASSSSSSRSSASPTPQVSSHAIGVPPTASSSAPRAGDEEIGSDLDDDDSENDDDETGAAGAAADGSGPGDIVYCTYDKVQRVKNKWKCVLKDGIVSVGGKDYLFSKCTGEFEW